MAQTHHKYLVQMPTVVLGLCGERLTHFPEIGLIPSILPFHPCLGTGARHVLQLATVPKHQKEVAEPGMDVDVLCILGWPRQINARIAGDTA